MGLGEGWLRKGEKRIREKEGKEMRMQERGEKTNKKGRKGKE